MNASIDYTKPEMISAIKDLILGESETNKITDKQFSYFIEVCKQTSLNPILKEIYLIKTKNGPQILSSLKGYLKVADHHPYYDGLESEIIMEGIKIIGAKCSVFRKDRNRPYTVMAYYEEVARPGLNGIKSMWDKMPKLMIIKVAKAMALRECFPSQLNGTYTDDEIPKDEKQVNEISHGGNDYTRKSIKDDSVVASSPPVIKDLDKMFHYRFKGMEDSRKEVLKEMLDSTGYQVLGDTVLTKVKLISFSKYLIYNPNEQNNEVLTTPKQNEDAAPCVDQAEAEIHSDAEKAA